MGRACSTYARDEITPKQIQARNFKERNQLVEQDKAGRII
jgi:hypothetical protein